MGLCLVQVIQDRLVHTGAAYSRLLVSGTGCEQLTDEKNNVYGTKTRHVVYGKVVKSSLYMIRVENSIKCIYTFTIFALVQKKHLYNVAATLYQFLPILINLNEYHISPLSLTFLTCRNSLSLFCAPDYSNMNIFILQTKQLMD